MSTKARVIIVGAGLAGLAAARCLAEQGVKVRIFDENPHPGGQLLRSIPAASRSTGGLWDSPRRRGLALLSWLRSRGIEILSQAQAVGSDGTGRVWVDSPRARLQELSAEAILLATGARETFLPFPGWTLPGVISTGGAQLLIKGSGVLPAPEMVIAGSGPLPPALAREVLQHKGRITALLDESRLIDSLGLLKLLPRQLPRLLQGLGLQARLLRAGVFTRRQSRIVHARGDGHLAECTMARLDSSGAPLPGSERTLRTSGLAVGWGLVPNIELGREMGCRAEFNRSKGGWVLVVNESQETSVSGIYAAGEPTGIAGGSKALQEGEMAGLAIACSLTGRLSREDRRRWNRLRKHLKQEQDFGVFLNRLSCIPAAGYRSIPKDTTICRCEQIRLPEILASIHLGFSTVASVKKATRCGMGRCQGRTCAPILQEILMAHPEAAQTPPTPLSVRSPVKPVALESLLEPEEGAG